eukprot:TRINITY_DN4989_c0_g1_i2.p1 TRINITY_DN4989_c0_g1~~TRINITY_DN4989_c0_g1_i2.p1  ORF type:complete len:331 (-),score=52.17 TRINITY_DN4989_c0_g1_i2:63-1055(-)
MMTNTDQLISIQDLPQRSILRSSEVATVFLSTLHGKQVAVKQWNTSFASEIQTLQFCREVGSLRLVGEHPHIVRFIGACSDPPAVVMEFKAGRSLEELVLDSSATITWSDFLRIAIGAAKGLAFIHQKDVLHRDLRSATILVAEDGQAQISDFGLSRVVDAFVHLTRGVGCAEWLAPERISSSKYGAAADVYSMGMVLWQMCARRRPFYERFVTLKSHARSEEEAFKVRFIVCPRSTKHLHDGVCLQQWQLDILQDVARHPVRPAIPLYVPKAIQQIIQQAWDSNPSARLGAPQLLAALQSVKLDDKTLSTEIPCNAEPVAQIVVDMQAI